MDIFYFPVVVFKTAILAASVFFYENLANLLPRPVFYWPMALCKYNITAYSLYLSLPVPDPARSADGLRGRFLSAFLARP